MKRSGLIWGAVLVILGIILLVDNLGLLDALGINLWDLIWPLLLILFGVWILWGTFGRQRTLESEQVTIPDEGASQAEIRFTMDDDGDGLVDEFIDILEAYVDRRYPAGSEPVPS